MDPFYILLLLLICLKCNHTDFFRVTFYVLGSFSIELEKEIFTFGAVPSLYLYYTGYVLVMLTHKKRMVKY